MLSLRQREYDIIEALSKNLGVSKVDLILSAVKRQYRKDSVMGDYLNHYIALLKNQITECEERIKKDRDALEKLKDEYEKVMDITRRLNNEDCEVIQSKGEDH